MLIRRPVGPSGNHTSLARRLFQHPAGARIRLISRALRLTGGLRCLFGLVVGLIGPEPCGSGIVFGGLSRASISLACLLLHPAVVANKTLSKATDTYLFMVIPSVECI
jgi:hypothetical protein